MGDEQSRIIRPNRSLITVPKQIIKEQLDQAHREDWADPERYLRQKQKALQYLPVRAPGLTNVDKLMSEVTRVFHDDLIRDPEVREAAQRAVWQAELDQRVAERDGTPPLTAPELDATAGPIRMSDEVPRGDVRGLDDLTDEKLRDLEYQEHEERIEP